MAETATLKQESVEVTPKASATSQDAIRSNGFGSGMSSGSVTAPVQSFSQQPPQPQKIPTYEQPQPDDYREPGATRQEGAYQNMLLNERSVRPSEMKDEG